MMNTRTSIDQAQRARSLLFTSTPATSFLQLVVDTAQPMDTSGDGNVESHCPRPLRYRIDTSQGVLLTSSSCDEIHQRQKEREEAARLKEERRRAAAERERPVALALYNLRFTSTADVNLTRPILLDFVRMQRVVGYSGWKRQALLEKAEELIDHPPPGGLVRAATAAAVPSGDVPALIHPLADSPGDLDSTQLGEQAAGAGPALAPASTPTSDHHVAHLPPETSEAGPAPLSLVQSLPEVLQVQSPIRARGPASRSASVPRLSRSSEIQLLIAQAALDAAAVSASTPVLRASRRHNSAHK
jgi:hypothetical protein